MPPGARPLSRVGCSKADSRLSAHSDNSGSWSWWDGFARQLRSPSGHRARPGNGPIPSSATPISGSRASRDFRANFGPDAAKVRRRAPMIANNQLKSTHKCTPTAVGSGSWSKSASLLSHCNNWEDLERAEGFEPSTPTLARLRPLLFGMRWCSTN